MSMKPMWQYLFALLPTACGGAQAPLPPNYAPAPPNDASAPPDNAPRLVRVGTKLYVTNAPAGVKRDSLLYARAPNALPGTKDHPKIGILRGVDRQGDALLVAWFTLLDENVDAALTGGGLPVDPIGQDIRARIGRHWGEYVGQPAAAFPKEGGDIVLELDMGRDDDVRSGDQYEVLGEPKADALNLTVDSFEGLGTCSVLPFGTDATRSRCQLDRGADAPVFREQHWVRGGYVRAITRRPVSPPSEPPQDRRPGE
ncbi:hypothetical protein [Sorangium sp. So ce394]|uniref:hypothetical protein n=1 Tax=Sorangium sp. So ce394 TaxID=3133310 RepID=UPI003F5B082D